VGGYNTLMEVEALKVKGLQFEPDAVVLIFVENDFDNIACEMAVLSGMSRPAWVNWAFRKSHLFRLLCLRLDWFGFRGDADPIERGLAAIGTNNVARALPLFKELSVKHKFQPWIAIWPRFEDNTVTNVHFLGDGSTLVIEALAGISDVPTCRLSESFNSHLESGGRPVNPKRDWTYGDGMHPKAEGVRIAAQALKSMLDSTPPKMVEDSSLQMAKAAAAVRVAQTLGIKGVDYKAALLQYGRWMEESDNPADAVRLLRGGLAIGCCQFRGARPAGPRVSQDRRPGQGAGSFPTRLENQAGQSRDATTNPGVFRRFGRTAILVKRAGAVSRRVKGAPIARCLSPVSLTVRAAPLPPFKTKSFTRFIGIS